MKKLYFTVDAALLKELGERLVGRPEIALAELIKNAYDADATDVVIRFLEDAITVTDNGSGMTFDEFRDYWMRVGSPHKAAMRVTARLGRPITGSKGVGRLSAQFLAEALLLRTVSDVPESKELQATIDWTQAVTAGDLQRAAATYEEQGPTAGFVSSSVHGTEIRLSGLRHQWTADTFRAVAREIWNLQPPFGSSQGSGFRVSLEHTGSQESVEAFDQQMKAVLGLWDARLIASLETVDGKRDVKLALHFRDGHKTSVRYALPDVPLHQLDFEIRIFDLRNRQPYGIRVDQARAYLREYGGVHVYDGGFRLPYYGAETDWLRVEIDHSHRLSRSRLLPEDLQRAGGLTFLPTNSRLYGSVRVDTGLERSFAEDEGNLDYLALQVSRDRLLDNGSSRKLRDLVRWALDYYAVIEFERSWKDRQRSKPIVPYQEELQRFSDTLREYRDQMPSVAFDRLHEQASSVAVAVQNAPARQAGRVSMLGALATAGASALAFEHEIDKQLSTMDAIANELAAIAQESGDHARLIELEQEVRRWLERARGTKDLFGYLAREEYRDEVDRLRARATVEEVARNARVLLRRVTVDTSQVDPDLLLPPGRFAEWTAIFQNLLTNAAAAVRRSPDKRVVISSSQNAEARRILFMDTGEGVNMAEAENLFEPFARRARLTVRQRALGLGGMGLGLTIARTVAEDLGSRIRFVAPQQGFSTAIEVSWTETDD